MLRYKVAEKGQDGNRLFEWVFQDAAKKSGRQTATHKVWTEGVHPDGLTSEPFLLQKLEYLHNNPVRKGLVERPEHWKYSSAGFYLLGEKGPLEIDVLEW